MSFLIVILVKSWAGEIRYVYTWRGFIRNIKLLRKHNIAAYSIYLSQSNLKISIRGRIIYNIRRQYACVSHTSAVLSHTTMYAG